MKILYGIGNNNIAVHGYKHKIVVLKSYDRGQNWSEIKTIKTYGSRKKCQEIFFNYLNKN